MEEYQENELLLLLSDLVPCVGDWFKIMLQSVENVVMWFRIL